MSPAEVEVIVTLPVGLVVPPGKPVAQVSAENRQTDEGHEQAGQSAQPRKELFRQDILRGNQHDEAQSVDPRGMGDGGRQAEDQGMAGCAARTHQIGPDDSLAVAGCEGVGRPKPDGRQQREQPCAGPVQRAIQQVGELVLAEPVGRRGRRFNRL